MLMTPPKKAHQLICLDQRMRCAFLTGTSSDDHTQKDTSRAHNTE